jgi:hypothetical protein
LPLVGWLLFWVMVLGTRFGKPTTVTLLQHQAGVFYDRGVRAREVGSGRHRVWTARGTIVVVDRRPISVSFEKRTVTLADGSTASFGFSGTVEVCDVTKVLYSDQNYNSVPAFEMLCSTRLVLNRYSSSQLIANGEKVSQEIMKKVKPRLRASGFDLQAFRMTQLSIVPQARREAQPSAN